MLERKGIAYKRTDLIPVVSKGALRAVGFPGDTVPALKIDGEKVQGSREIARELDRISPSRRSFPADPEQRAEVEEAERFGDEELQQPIRAASIWNALRRDKRAAAQLLGGRQARDPDRRSRSRPRRRSIAAPPRSTTPTTSTCAPTSRRCPAALDQVDG